MHGIRNVSSTAVLVRIMLSFAGGAAVFGAIYFATGEKSEIPGA
jgi:hypothetical protein